MGITKTFKKLMGRNGTENASTAGKDLHQNVSADDVPSTQDTAAENNSADTKQTRQVGSKWEHKHDDLDWHSMSRPHPLPVAEKDVNESAAPDVAPQEDTTPEQVLDDETQFSKKDILCKFVVQHGQRIGETISIDSGHLVFKNGAENLSIPMSSISGVTDEDVMIGDFERGEALKLGEEWHIRTTDSLKFDEKGMLIND